MQDGVAITQMFKQQSLNHNFLSQLFPPHPFRTYLGIKSAYECREAEDGGRLGGEERQDGQHEGPAVGVRGGHGLAARRVVVVPAVRGLGAAGARRAAGRCGGGAHVALVAQEAGEHDERAAEHHA